jgi:hypothetical protein
MATGEITVWHDNCWYSVCIEAGPFGGRLVVSRGTEHDDAPENFQGIDLCADDLEALSHMISGVAVVMRGRKA